jgi:hypothetical protein
MKRKLTAERKAWILKERSYLFQAITQEKRELERRNLEQRFRDLAKNNLKDYQRSYLELGQILLDGYEEE